MLDMPQRTQSAHVAVTPYTFAVTRDARHTVLMLDFAVLNSTISIMMTKDRVRPGWMRVRIQEGEAIHATASCAESTFVLGSCLRSSANGATAY